MKLNFLIWKLIHEWFRKSLNHTPSAHKLLPCVLPPVYRPPSIALHLLPPIYCPVFLIMANFVFLQVDEEADDVVLGRYWPPDHVNGVFNVSSIQSKNIKMFQSL